MSVSDSSDQGVVMTAGVKGSDVYTEAGVGDGRVALNTKLVRGADGAAIRAELRKLLQSRSDEQLTDAVVMAFQARDVRGGKGERKLFHDLFAELCLVHPDLGKSLVPLISEYGSWDDVFTLGHDAISGAGDLWSYVDVAVEQLKKDEAAVKAYDAARLAEAAKFGGGVEVPRPSISLCAKWAPREGKQLGKLAKYVASRLGGEGSQDYKHSQVMASYRKRLSALNKYLETVEVKECAGDWEEIEPKKVPARARELKKAAYLNEKVRKPRARDEVELRHPDDPARMKCRENFQAFFKAAAEGKVKISGAETLYPHEVVTKAMHATTEEDCNSLNSVWREMVKKAGEGGGLGDSVFMCDFSGSMESGVLRPWQ